MSKYHVQAVFEQFPWLKEHLKDYEGLRNATVSRADTKILDFSAGCSEGNVYILLWCSQIFLFSQGGDLVAKHEGRWYHPLLFFWTRFRKTTVREMLIKLQTQAHAVSYIVTIDPLGCVVYKSPKGGTIEGLLQQAEQEKAAERRSARRSAQEEIQRLAS